MLDQTGSLAAPIWRFAAGLRTCEEETVTDTPAFANAPRLTRRSVLKVAGAGAAAGGLGLGFRVGSRSAQAADPVLCTMVCEQGASYARNFNPFTPTARWAATHAMYEPLMIYNYATSTLEPWLATAYEWADENKTLKMTIRTGVTWSDGQPFSAGDVAYTFQLMRDNPALIGSASGAWDDYLADVAAPDDATAVFTFKTVYTPALYLLSNQFIVPKHIWETIADPVKETNPNPVSTGPFSEIPVFRPQVYEVHRNPNYWGGADIKIDGLRFPAFTGNDQISAAVVGGDIDWGGLVANPDETFVAKDPEHNHYWWPTTSDVCLYLNTTRKPFDDPNLRKAIGAALDRPQMIQTAIWGKSTPANATGLPESAFADWIDPTAVEAGANWVTRDVDHANQVLDEAGYARDGDKRKTADGEELKFSAIVPGGWTDWVAVLQIVVNNLKEVGIEVELQTISADAWTTSVYTGDFDIALGSGSKGATPFEFYRGTMSASTARPVGEQAPENYHRYANADADALLSSFAETGDVAQQKEIAKQLQAIFVDQAPVVPLYGAPDWGLYTTKRIAGFPNEENPYAPLTNLGTWPTTLIVFRHLTPAT